ncbi:Interphotoreceptor matrix proteoglycan [Dirofilaria immitis]
MSMKGTNARPPRAQCAALCTAKTVHGDVDLFKSASGKQLSREIDLFNLADPADDVKSNLSILCRSVEQIKKYFPQLHLSECSLPDDQLL